MSFGANVKAELAHLWPEKPCCQQAELAGILALGGQLVEREGVTLLTFGSHQAAVARLVYRLLRDCCRVKPQVQTTQHFYRLAVPLDPDLWRWLAERPGLLDRNRRYSLRQFRRAGLANNCCRRAFLRGAFLAAGSVNDPRHAYHLEVLLPNQAWGANLAALLLPFGLKPHLTTRRNTPVLYFKDGEQIGQFLNVIGAHAALLDFEGARVYKEVRNRVNRLVNCDTANLNRTVEASLRQAASIAYLRDCLGLAALPANLREVAELRLQYPDASLRELGQMLTPRLGKAAVSYRLRRLEELAARLAEERA